MSPVGRLLDDDARRVVRERARARTLAAVLTVDEQDFGLVPPAARVTAPVAEPPRFFKRLRGR